MPLRMANKGSDEVLFTHATLGHTFEKGRV